MRRLCAHRCVELKPHDHERPVGLLLDPAAPHGRVHRTHEDAVGSVHDAESGDGHARDELVQALSRKDSEGHPAVGHVQDAEVEAALADVALNTTPLQLQRDALRVTRNSSACTCPSIAGPACRNENSEDQGKVSR